MPADEFREIGASDAAPEPPPHDRPGWPTPFGIACIGLLCGGLGLVSPLFIGGMLEPQLNGAPLPDAWKLEPMDVALGVVGLVLAVTLLIGGIMLIGRATAARPVLLAYAVLAMPVNIYSYLRQMAKQASVEQWARDYPDNAIAQGINQGGAGSAAGEICGLSVFLLLGVVFPLFVFVWFAAVKVRPEQITGVGEGVY